eukprot:13815-Heterococcus_DN1.PRE.1
MHTVTSVTATIATTITATGVVTATTAAITTADHCTHQHATLHYNTTSCITACRRSLYSEVNVAVEVTECSLDSNTAVRFAGALFLSDGGSITASNLTKSSATSGGAIYSQVSAINVEHTSTLTLRAYLHCTRHMQGATVLDSCVLSGNTAVQTGGSILVAAAVVQPATVRTSGAPARQQATTATTLSNCTLHGNTAASGGAVACAVDANVAMTECL